MLRRIVVPIDGSPCAAHALEYARRLAKLEEAKLDICTFVDAVEIAGRNVFKAREETHVAAAKAEADRIVAEAVASAISAGVPAQAHVALGKPATEIVAYAGKIHADAIVMGTHGRSGFRRMFMGSVAEEVLRAAACPVIVAREKASFEPPAAGSPKIVESSPVHVLRLMEVAASDFERLYGEIASFLSGPGTGIAGLQESQLLGSLDSRRIAIVTQFRSQHDWARAQWDARFGEFLEEIASNSALLDFGLYRGDRFLTKGPPENPAAAEPAGLTSAE